MAKYDTNQYLWNSDHNFKNVTETDWQSIAIHIEADIETDVGGFEIQNNCLIIPGGHSVTIKKPGYLIKITSGTDVSSIQKDAYTITPLHDLSIKEINYGCPLVDSFRYTDQLLVWSNGIALQDYSAASVKDVAWNTQNKQFEWRTAWKWYNISNGPYRAQNGSQELSLFYLKHQTEENRSQEEQDTYFITEHTGLADNLNHMFWNSPEDNININLIKLLESTEDLSWDLHDHWCTLNQKQYFVPKHGKVIRVHHLPADELKIPSRVASLNADYYANSDKWQDLRKWNTMEVIAELSQAIPLPTHCSGESGNATYIRYAYIIDSSADAKLTSSASHIESVSNPCLFGFWCDQEKLQWDNTWRTAFVQTSYSEVESWWKANKNTFCRNVATIELKQLRVYTGQEPYYDISIQNSVFPLLFLNTQTKTIEKTLDDNEAKIKMNKLTQSVLIKQGNDEDVFKDSINWTWQIMIKNWMFETQPKFDIADNSFVHDVRVFATDQDPNWKADYSYACLHDTIWWDQNLLSANSLFLNYTNSETVATDTGSQINRFQSYGCWDLLQNAIMPLSCELAFNLTFNKNYEIGDKTWSDSPLLYYKTDTDQIDCLYLPVSRPSIPKWYVCLYHTAGQYGPVKDHYVDFMVDTVRDFDNGNVAAVAAFVTPDKKSSFNTAITYGYFWISNRVKITATHDGTQTHWRIENYTLNTYNFYDNIFTSGPLSYDRHTSSNLDELDFNNHKLKPKQNETVIWTFSQDQGWLEHPSR